MNHENHCCHHEDHAGHDHCEIPDTRIRLGKRLKIVGAGFILLFLLSYLPPLAEFHNSLVEYLGLVWWAILLGLILGGMIDYFVPEGFVYRYLGREGLSALLYATVAGFLLSACSHGILAIAIQLYKKGASIPAVITFLLASPWANLPVTILLFGFFGWQAFLFVFGAMGIALTTGLVFSVLERQQLIESSLQVAGSDQIVWSNVKDFKLRESLVGVSRGAVNLANMVLWWIIIGFVIAAVIKTWVPHEWMMAYFGPDFMGLVLTLGVATIIEVCSEGSSPIAFEIYQNVGSLGNPFVFLMAGVVTDYTEIGLIWTNIGRKTAILLPIVTVPQVLLLAYAFNRFL
ncbi:MAG: permease [bacterium]